MRITIPRYLVFLVIAQWSAAESIEGTARTVNELPMEAVFSVISFQATTYMPQILEFTGRIYLTIQDADPSEELIILLSEIGLDVDPGSKYTRADPGAAIKDRPTCITVDVVGPIGLSELKLKYFWGDSGYGYGSTFSLELQDGSWVIVGEEDAWMS